jgi:hypothetical protein
VAKSYAENEIPGTSSVAAGTTEPETPHHHTLVPLLSRVPNKDFHHITSTSALPSPSSSVSGKLIKLFEELSKPVPKSASVENSPTHSIALCMEGAAMERVLDRGGFMDGIVDEGMAEEKAEREEEQDGMGNGGLEGGIIGDSSVEGDSLDECF